MKKNEIYETVITGIDDQGQGIGHIDGMAVFVKDTVPGDTVKVRLVKVKKTYAYGRLEELLIPSEDRADPRCPKARACGGCSLQHIEYQTQLKLKQQRVYDALCRIGGLTDPDMEPVTGMEDPWRFRNKMQFPIGTDGEGQAAAGFYAARTHALIPIDDCPIGMDVNADILQVVRMYIDGFRISVYDEMKHEGLIRHVLTRAGFRTRELMVVLVINGETLPHADWLLRELVRVCTPDWRLVSVQININQDKTNRILGPVSKVLYGEPYITERLQGLTFRISAASFFQVNPIQTERIYCKALEYAHLTGTETVWDMYCGTGTISLFLAKHARQVYGVEIASEAIEDAKENARINGISNAAFYVGRAEEIVPKWASSHPEGVDVIVVDPPRKGCERSLLETIARMHPKRMVYVSCDPATLARDVGILRELGFQFEKAAAFDAFCHSVHVETVVGLSGPNFSAESFLQQ